MASLGYQLHNIRTQIAKPQTKIFFIGYNKCGTTSLHHLLASAGIRSVHYRAPVIDVNALRPFKPFQRIHLSLAGEIVQRTSDISALKKLLDRYTAFSDLFYYSENSQIEAAGLFEVFHQLYPDAFFILNDRDENKWISSRVKHDNGSLLERAMHYYQSDAESVVSTWRAQRIKHIEKVLSFFHGHRRFLHFRIDNDDIGGVIQHLSPDFRVSEKDWTIRNKTM
ncbi:MAG: sulfotransferase [Pseudomonadota bacterium]